MESFTQRFVEALRHLEESSEPEQIVQLFDAAAEISNPLFKHETGGPEAADRFWRSYRGSFKSIRSEFRKVIEREGVSFLEWTSDGTTNKDRPFRYGGVSVMEHEVGSIKAFRTYFDTAQIDL